MFGWNQFFVAAGTGAVLSVTAAQADVAISGKPTQNMSCDAGVCTATAKKAVLNAGDLQALLASGNATVKTGSLANNIEIDRPLTWANTSRLTLDARQSVIVKKPVTVSGTGALTVTTNDGGSNGVFMATGKGAVIFWDLASSLIVNGESYTLAGDIKTLAAGITANPSGDYALAKSYDAKADGTYTSVPIPTKFTGKFEGLGNSIAHLAVQDSSSEEVGLFSEIESTSLVENIMLARVDVTGVSANSVGSIAGGSSGTIRNVHATGRVTASLQTASGGGLVGGNGGLIAQSSAACSVTGGYAGGLAGGDGGTISSSFANGSETGGVTGGISGFEVGLVEDSYASVLIKTESSAGAGGIVGSIAAYGAVERSFSTGSIALGDGGYAGGIVAYIDGGTVDRSFSTTTISVGHNGAAGGIIAGMCGCEGPATVSNSYATGSVHGKSGSQTGGVAGFIQAEDDTTITAAYSTGSVRGSSTYEGGFVGFDDNPGDIASGYWDLDTSGIANRSRGAGNVKNDPGIGGLTDTQLKSGLPAGFDPKVWGQSPNINNGYPYLLANPPQ